MDLTYDSPNENKLDKDFRRILCVIKEYIQYVNSTQHLSLYRAWLERLSVANDEKEERNIYLFELARQIKSNRLLPPFNRPPFSGSLRNLPKISLFKSTEAEKSIHGNRPVPQERIHYPHADPEFVKQHVEQNPKIVNFSPPVRNPYEDRYAPRAYFEPPDACFFHPNYMTSNDAATDKAKASAKNKKRKLKSASSFQKLLAASSPKSQTEACDKKGEPMLNKMPSTPGPQRMCNQVEFQHSVEGSVNDDSSWCDLSEATQTSVNFLASGDTQKSPPNVQEKVKQCEEIDTILPPQLNNQNKEARQEFYDQQYLSEEVENVNRKLHDFNLAKHSLKDTNFISSDWKKTIEGLQMRLTETLSQNNDFKSIINALQIKLKEEAAKNKEYGELNQKQSELCKREIEALHQKQAENIKKLEKSFHAKLVEAEKTYQQKIETLNANYDTKIKEMQETHESSKMEKDQEMFRLSEIIQQQCIRMSNEIAALRNQLLTLFNNNDDADRIVVLQKCVSKMDKLFQRSEKDYLKQIDKLKLELDMKDKVMQIQLKTQRADLITRTSVEKQKQFDEVINNLEVKYIKMLDENQVMQTRGKSPEKIDSLKQLLDTYKIDYKDIGDTL